MKNLADLIRLPMVETLGWTLLHFLWQGALIALILAALLWLLKNHVSSLRYGLACASLALMFLCPMITYRVLETRTPTKPIVETALPLQTEVAQPALVLTNEPVQPVANPIVFAPEGGTGTKQSWLERNLKPLLPYLVVFWGIGVLVLSLRLLGGLWYLRKLRTQFTESVSTALMAQLKNVAERLGLARPVQLRESLVATVPLVVGWLRPMILLPSSVISGLSVKQLEMILAHELAHIRRHDYLVNLLQSVIETLLFYHPGVWWVSHQIRKEREHCCDDLAVKVCGGDKQSYARTLAELDDLRPNFSLAQAVSGGSLLNRIIRLADKAIPRSIDPRQWIVGLSSILASLFTFTVIGVNLAFAHAMTVTANDQWTPVRWQDAKGISMVQVPKGSFEMGSNQAEIDTALQLCGNCSTKDFDYERRGGLQTFSKPFWIDETEVTRGDYDRCVADVVCVALESNMQSNSADQPINNLTWNDAARFCTLWRNGARLPTEAEWEYAARGPDGLIFPWGNDWNDSFANTKASTARVTTAVKSYPQGVSWVGAFDMAGNLYEWASSLAQPYPFVNDNRNLTDPDTDPVNPSYSPKVVQRGGSFFDAATYVRSAYRYNYGLGYHFIGVGFRCVRADADF